MDVKPENYDILLDVSLRGMLYLCQAFIPTLLVEEEARRPAPPRYPHKPESDFLAAGTTRPPRPECLDSPVIPEICLKILLNRDSLK